MIFFIISSIFYFFLFYFFYFYSQSEVFEPLQPGEHKIILSTNIAETSVTIDDVAVVIDSGKLKEKVYDPHVKLAYLRASWISQGNILFLCVSFVVRLFLSLCVTFMLVLRIFLGFIFHYCLLHSFVLLLNLILNIFHNVASARQRKGRAGRTRAGVCFHLFSKRRHISLPEFQDSEILRMPLEELVLQVSENMDSDTDIYTVTAVISTLPARHLLLLLSKIFCFYFSLSL